MSHHAPSHRSSSVKPPMRDGERDAMEQHPAELRPTDQRHELGEFVIEWIDDEPERSSAVPPVRGPARPPLQQPAAAEDIYEATSVPESSDANTSAMPVHSAAHVPADAAHPLSASTLGDAPSGIGEASPDEDLPTRSLPVRFWLSCGRVLEWLFGVAALLVGLAIVASIPVLQLLSLGYLLEASGRISRSGRLRDGFIGIRTAAWAGGLVMGTWLVMVPVRFVSQLWSSSQLIDPTSGVTLAWRVALLVLTVVTIVHIATVWYCGARLRHFFWPLLAPLFIAMWTLRRIVASQALRPLVQPVVGTISRRLLRDVTTVPPLTSWFPPAIIWAGIQRGRMYVEARDAVWEFVVGLRLRYYFWLGVRGFVGAIAWLFVPVMLLIAVTHLGGDSDPEAADGLAALAGMAGSLLLAVVMFYLPFVQAHFAAERRFKAFFEVGRVRALFRCAPLAFWLALLITLVFALPLYLLKIEFVPRELLWLPSLVFVAFVYPARLMMGWAMGRARRREQPRHVLVRWLATLGELPIVAFYVLVVYFTQYFSWTGAWGLFEQHAFLLPAPFLGL